VLTALLLYYVALYLYFMYCEVGTLAVYSEERLSREAVYTRTHQEMR